MGSVLKDELIKVEGLIKDACPAFDVNGMSGKEKDYLRALLMERKHLLNRMLLCTPAEVARMKDVNARLFDLTTRLHEKTNSLYRALLSRIDDILPCAQRFRRVMGFSSDGTEIEIWIFAEVLQENNHPVV